MIIGFRKIFVLFLLVVCIFFQSCDEKIDTSNIAQDNYSEIEDITISDIKDNYKDLNIKNPVLKAKITEFENVKNYTYLYLQDSTGKIWAAIPKTDVKIGEEITISDIIVMKDFKSKTLNKTFDTILFAVHSSGCPFEGMYSGKSSGKPSDMMTGFMPDKMVSPHGKESAFAVMGDKTDKTKIDFNNIKVNKASGENAYTIEEIYSKKEELAGKNVVVRAKVVKFLPEIMEKNWIHIQDGTGSTEEGDNDIAVSTTEKADVGDEVVIKGVLGIDKDFGLGCSFSILIENASVVKPQENES